MPDTELLMGHYGPAIFWQRFCHCDQVEEGFRQVTVCTGELSPLILRLYPVSEMKKEKKKTRRGIKAHRCRIAAGS